MSTTTTTTVDAVEAAFVAAAEGQVAANVTVWRSWPGPQATTQMVFLTDAEWDQYDDAVIKSGRRYRDEEYDINFEIWSLKSGDPDGSATAKDEVRAIWNACEAAVVADGSTVRSVAGVTNVVCQLVRREMLEVGTGWGAVITGRLHVTARLT